MTNPIFYKRITGSNIQGDATTVTEPQGTLVVTNNGDLRLHNGTTAGGITVVTDSDWVNPNERTWKIRTYNGGAAVSFDGTTPVAWFDVNTSPFGLTDFRGAIIEYHAYLGGGVNGTIIGTIHLASDYDPGDATHTENLSGDNTLQSVSVWGSDSGHTRGLLCFKTINGVYATLQIQWTAKLFYGLECAC